MTRQRNDNHSTEFGLWLRNQPEIDSKQEGYTATNLDFLWRNYNTCDWMLIEEKRFMAELTYPQRQMFGVIDRACSDATGYHGFHVLQFENTNPDDGRIYLDGLEISRTQLLDFLRFK